MEENQIITFDQLYRDYTLKALNRACCVKRAAFLLGMTDRTVYRWKRAYGIVWDPAERKYVIKKPIKSAP